MNELLTIATAAVEKAKAALAGNGAANDMKIKVGSYTNDFGSWSPASVVAATIIEEAETIICRKFYAAKPSAEMQADFDAATDLTEAFTAENK